jgi:hypothetical protein
VRQFLEIGGGQGEFIEERASLSIGAIGVIDGEHDPIGSDDGEGEIERRGGEEAAGSYVNVAVEIVCDGSL